MSSLLYPIAEIFETIQGEATFTGTPAVFIRLQGCDVGCPWCDTKYSWPQEAATATLSVSAIIERVLAYQSIHTVITGGEPCQYDLMPLISALRAELRFVQVETSGTYPIAIEKESGIWITVSPKINMKKPFIMESIEKADEIKFPVGKLKDIDNLLTLKITNKLTWLQPLSLNDSATKICMETAIRYGFKVSFQVHRLIGIP
jgi:7-carboxy-7-deazaguanine synthase